MLLVQSQEANMRSLQSLKNVRLHPFLEEPQRGKRRQTSKCARRKLINQDIFARCVAYVRKVSTGSCLKPLATSALELCDTSPAGVVAAELCLSRSKGNWEVFLQGIYRQRRKPTDTHALDGSINTHYCALMPPVVTHREDFFPHMDIGH